MDMPTHWLHEDEVDMDDPDMDDVPCDECGEFCVSSRECVEIMAEKGIEV